jgi:hypothetical protein
MNIINIPKTIGVTSGLNECTNLFQWVTSAISSLKSQSNETQKERLQAGDIRQLQSDIQCLIDTLSAMYDLIDRAEWSSGESTIIMWLPAFQDSKMLCVMGKTF